MQTGTLISLGLYFALMLAIGLYAWRKSTGTVGEYMLGGRSLGPAVTALSAGASDMSGWLLLGLPGAAFATGLPAAWIGIGLFAGALANWIVVAPRLRVQTEELGDALTIPDWLSKRFPERGTALRLVSALVIVVFFALYTSAGLVAGGKLFDTALGGSYATGLWITAAVVVAYTLFGGFLAVSLTDFVQGCIMLIALVIVPVVALSDAGGWERTVGAVRDVNPAFLSLFAGATTLGVISSLGWGLGYFGQPHIIVRFMAIRSVRDVPTARAIGMSWMGVSLLGSLGVGLAGLAYASETGLRVDDPETIFILLSELLFHPLVTGFLFAAILAAIMSTISSQLLVSSSSLTEDAYRLLLRREAGQRELVTVGRLAVLAVALVALVLALNPENSVLGLVANAWAGFGAAFGPVVLLALTSRRVTGAGALAGLLVGAGTVIVWIAAGLDGELYALVPGFGAGLAAALGVSAVKARELIVAG